MGSTISSPQGFEEDDLSIKARKVSEDPILQKLQNLHVITPILKQQTTDASLQEILLQRSSSQASEALDPTSTAKLFALYQRWHTVTAAKIGKIQEELGYKIIGVEELSMKLQQRLTYASRAMDSSATHLHEVHSLQVEIAEMKCRLSETILNCKKLGQKVDSLGLHEGNTQTMAIVY